MRRDRKMRGVGTKIGGEKKVLEGREKLEKKEKRLECIGEGLRREKKNWRGEEKDWRRIDGIVKRGERLEGWKKGFEERRNGGNGKIIEMKEERLKRGRRGCRGGENDYRIGKIGEGKKIGGYRGRFEEREERLGR